MSTTATAIFAAGCFWSVEHAFRPVRGVVDVVSGYTGGSLEHPSYEQVCSDTTGHAEAVLISYDPGIVAYEQLLEIFWKIHDPTTPNRQGPDVGSQYRSAVFVQDAAERRAAEASRDREQQRLQHPIVTEITDATPFYRAEDYHQRYFEKHGAACQITTI
jgi:peptide-methionine (S)-S-oxide reductase